MQFCGLITVFVSIEQRSIQTSSKFAEAKHGELRQQLTSLLNETTQLQGQNIQPDKRGQIEDETLEVGAECEDRREALRHIRGSFHDVVTL